MVVRVLALLPPAPARRIQQAIDERGVHFAAHRGERPPGWLERQGFDLLLLPPEGRAALPIPAIRQLPDHPEVIVVVDEEQAELRARLLAEGAFAVLPHRLPKKALRDALRALVARRRSELLHRLHAESPSPPRLDDFASASPAMQAFVDLARKVVAAESSLLILGETGVGKEHLARAIHGASPRPGPFLAVNCAALPEHLIESELFGHEAGAFTGAIRTRRGCFELADRGTIFLDEIGDLPAHVQGKLLRVLQDRAVVPVGGEEPAEVDVRVMAATNRDLAAEMAQGRFRADLYYRLAVVTLTVPPLRERALDIPLLVDHYVAHFQQRFQRPAREIDPDALELLLRYRWPGNVRELINVVERAVLLCTDGRVTPADLPEDIRRSGRVATPLPPPVSDSGASYHEMREQVLATWERSYFTDLLRRAHGRMGRAAALAGVSPRFLYGRIRELGLHKDEYRSA